VIGAVIAVPPYLVARWLRRRPRRAAKPPGRACQQRVAAGQRLNAASGNMGGDGRGDG
jgi:hypothetical protein